MQNQLLVQLAIGNIMRILKFLILFVFIFSTELVGQNIVHLCVGSQHNFAVPYHSGSSYNWTIKNGIIANIISGNGSEQINIELKDTGVSQLIVEEVNSSGCIGYDSILIEVHPLPKPIITANSNTSFCEGDSVILSLVNDYEIYSWNPNFSSEPSITVYNSGDYSVNVIDSFGCENVSNIIQVVSQSLLLVDFVVDGICVHTPIKLINTSTASQGNIISSIWDLGDGLFMSGDSIYHTYHEKGDYEVSLTINTDIGCKSSQTKILSVLDNPEANFIYNPIIPPSTLDSQIDFINTSVNAVLFWWDFGDLNVSSYYNPSHVYEDPGIYDVKLIVQDVNECRDSIIKPVLISYDFVLHIPKAFTPNNDGENDTFYPKGLRMHKYQSYLFQIYNKWGERIFETDNIDNKWDGARCPSEVYNWVLIIVDELGKIREQNGQVTLIR